jgi:hypothetical protein
MKRSERNLSLATVAAGLLLMVAMAPAPQADAATAGARSSFEVADLYFELNDTDGDLGLHGLIDGEAWQLLEIESPDESLNLRVNARGSLRQQGMTELFFESAEPPFDELPPEAFFARFPEGTWEISGLTLDGEEMESTDRLRHVMPAPPDDVLVGGVPAAEDCEAVPLPVVTEPVVISWDPVTASHPEVGRSGPIVVVRYELVIEREGPSPLSLKVELPPEVTEFEIPEGFTAPGEAFKFEILVRERTGNQTGIESCFEIE